jgi:prepilin-type N-terminal cleavage/methylation domain-containing protein
MKKAFTMLELVFVIVIVGILSYFVSSSFQRNPLREAADQVVSHIRYTQHLAMMDDRFNPNNRQWYSEMWIFWIRSVHDVNNNNEQEWFYEIFSDRPGNGGLYNGNSTIEEEAIDPLTKETLGNGSFDNTVDDNKMINLTRKYGINNIVFTGGDNINHNLITRVAFDSLGRPYRDADPNLNVNWYNMMLISDMNITLINSDGNVTITVTKETGYPYISAQNY